MLTEPKKWAGKFTGRVKQMALEAPKNTIATAFMLTEAMRVGCETLGAWSRICEAIIHDMKDEVVSECYKRSDCVRLNGPELLKELYELEDLLRMTMLFSKKRFGEFLLVAGFDKADVLYRKRIARIFKPAFTVLLHRKSKSILVLIRGTRSIKDTLTDLCCFPFPFKMENREVSGYAHFGMLWGARRIKRHCLTILLETLGKYPDFKVKIVGHSLGGGTAALLTYKLREIKELSSCTCVTFGPAACMTLDLAEFGKPFVTSIINGSDIVPTLSYYSFLDFISKFKMKHGQGTSTPSETSSYEPVSINEWQLIMECMPDDPDDDDKYNEAASDNDDDEDECNEGADSDDKDEFKNEVEKLKQEKQDKGKICVFYPPGKIRHIVPANCSENHNSNRKYPDEELVCLYETPTKFYEKLRLSNGSLPHHRTRSYSKNLSQLINQLKKEHPQYG